MAAAYEGTKLIKSKLKLVQDALKCEKYDEAVQQCRSILEIDEDNYNAMVKMGYSLEYLGKDEEALSCYLRATAKEPNQVTAWKGLANFYEKHHEKQGKKSLPDVYEQLLRLIDDVDKRYPVLIKCTELLLIQKVPQKVYELLNQYGKDCASTPQRKVVIDVKYIQTLSSLNRVDELDEKYNNLMIQLENVELLSSDVQFNIHDVFRNYIFYLLEGNADYHLRLLNVLKLYCKLCPESTVANQWLSLCLIEHALLESHLNLSAWSIPMDMTFDLILSHIQESHPFLHETLRYLQEGSLLSCKETVFKNFAQNRQSLSSHCLLILLQLKFHQYAECLQACNVVQKEFLQQTKLDDVLFPRRFAGVAFIQQFVCLSMWKARAFIRSSSLTLEELHAVSVDNSFSYFVLLASLKSQHLSFASNLLQELCSTYCSGANHSLNCDRANILLLTKTHQYDAAFQRSISLLDQKDNFVNYWDLFLHALILRCLNRFDEALIFFVKSAERDNHFGDTYYYLGLHYESTCDLEKAKEFYERCYNLDVCYDDNVRHYCDILYQLSEFSVALKVLERYSKNKCSSSWCYFYLGLNYLKQGKITDAIVSLQTCLKLDKSNYLVWECLGDAYEQRGSYESAMKVLNKVIQLKPDNILSHLRMAHVYYLMRDHVASTKEYEKISKKLDNCREDEHFNLYCLLVNKGFAQNYFEISKEGLNDCRFTLALHGFVSSIRYTWIALKIDNNSYRCLWKILGDSLYNLSMYEDVHLRDLDIPIDMIEPEDEDCVWTRLVLIKLSLKCYQTLITKFSVEAHDYHDSATCFFRLYLITLNRKYLDRCEFFISKCLTLNSKHHHSWSLLGLVSMYKTRNAQAQHCFITSLNISPTANAWVNLGTFYLRMDQFKLANRCYSQAQALDPEFAAGWMGQSVLSQLLQSNETLDLLRKVVSLPGRSIDSVLGFSHWTTKLITNQLSHLSFLQSTEQKMKYAALSATACNLSHLVLPDCERTTLLNNAALLFEYIKFPRLAIQNANELLQHQLLNEVPKNTVALKNSLRILCTSNEFDVENFVNFIDKSKLNSVDYCYISFAKLLARQENWSEYMKMAASLTDSPSYLSEVWCVAACLFMKFGNINMAQETFMRMVQVEGSVQKFESLHKFVSFAIRAGFQPLISVGLSEMQNCCSTSEHYFLYTHLETCSSVVFDKDNALSCVKSMLFRYPHRYLSWLTLVQYHCSNNAAIDSETAMRCMQKALSLSMCGVGCSPTLYHFINAVPIIDRPQVQSVILTCYKLHPNVTYFRRAAAMIANYRLNNADSMSMEETSGLKRFIQSSST